MSWLVAFVTLRVVVVAVCAWGLTQAPSALAGGFLLAAAGYLVADTFWVLVERRHRS